MSKQRKPFLVLAVIMASLATALFVPGLIYAGDLEPPAAPAPTMKTLDQIPPTWSQKLDASERFELVLDGAAVLDKETGLVWARSLFIMNGEIALETWEDAMWDAPTRYIGGRYGWCLPTSEEFMSLLAGGFPEGVFDNNVLDVECWSADSDIVDPTTKARMFKKDSYGSTGNYARTKSTPKALWLVRGGKGCGRY